MDLKAIDEFLNQPHIIVAYMGAFLFIACFMVAKTARNSGYKEGQIDAINGKVKYRLADKENGEKVYVEI